MPPSAASGAAAISVGATLAVGGPVMTVVPEWLRWVLFAVGIALIVFGIVSWFMARRRDNDQNGDPKSSPGGAQIHNVTSHNQSGGITAHTVHQAPPPGATWKFLSVAARQQDGTYLSVAEVRLTSSHAMSALAAEASGRAILSLGWGGSGMIVGGWGEHVPAEGPPYTRVVRSVGPPLAPTYTLFISTQGPEQPSLRLFHEE